MVKKLLLGALIAHSGKVDIAEKRLKIGIRGTELQRWNAQHKQISYTKVRFLQGKTPYPETWDGNVCGDAFESIHFLGTH